MTKVNGLRLAYRGFVTGLAAAYVCAKTGAGGPGGKHPLRPRSRRWSTARPS